MRSDSLGPEGRLKAGLYLMLFILMVGVLGYMIIEDANFLDALYMTVITLTTVGFREAIELHDSGKLFTILLLFLGVGTIFYVVGQIIQMFLEGQIGGILEMRRMERRMQNMKDHYVVAGYGRVGQIVCAEFKKRGIATVVIESDDRLEELLRENENQFIIANAAQDEVLTKANITKARALISTISDEAHTVYLVLSARQMNPDLFIIARADSNEAQRKLERAGADRVICPHELGGIRMALSTLRPTLLDFMQIEPYGGDLGITVEEVLVGENSRVDGVALKDSKLRENLGIMVVGLKKEDQELVINPSANTVISAGDKLIIIGKGERLSELDDYIEAK